MTAPALDWSAVDLVVFDVDGTLYDQPPLRRKMLVELLGSAVRTRQLYELRALRAYRRRRETLADAEAFPIEALQYEGVAGLPAGQVRAIVGEWMERRPLRHIRRCRAAGIAELFAGLRRAGKRIAIWSDYPAADKLAALGLEADWIAEARHPEINRLKPHPAGLQWLLDRSGIAASRALLIGDRVERDAAAGARCGVRTLIRAAPAASGAEGFGSYADPVFADLLTENAGAAVQPVPHAVGESG